MPVNYLENFLVNAEGREIEIKGKGKIMQISFLCQNKYTLLSVIIDNVEYPITNVYCAEFVSLPNSMIQTKEREYDCESYYNVCCRMEFKFENGIKIKFANTKHPDKIKSAHIYYEN